MIGFGLTLDQVAKNWMRTDRARNNIERKQIKSLKAVGSYSVTVAKRSIRPVGKFGKPSKPRKPPKSRQGFLKNLIRAAYFQTMDGGVMISGPVFKRVRSVAKPINKTIPEALETSGTIRLRRPKRVRANTILNSAVRKRAVRAERQRTKGMRRRRKVRASSFVTLQPGSYPMDERPFMVPALKKTVHAARLRRHFSNIYSN